MSQSCKEKIMLLLDQLLKKHPLLKQLGGLPGLSMIQKVSKKTPAGKLIDKYPSAGMSAASMFKKRYGK